MCATVCAFAAAQLAAARLNSWSTRCPSPTSTQSASAQAQVLVRCMHRAAPWVSGSAGLAVRCVRCAVAGGHLQGGV